MRSDHIPGSLTNFYVWDFTDESSYDAVAQQLISVIQSGKAKSFAPELDTQAYIRKIDGTGEYLTTATVFVGIDKAGLALVVPTKGRDVLVGFTGVVKREESSSYSPTIFVDVEVDGKRQGSNNGLAFIKAHSIDEMNISFTHPINGLSPGEHLFKLVWKVDRGVGTMLANSGTFWVREL